jgi:hypothetical protein
LAILFYEIELDQLDDVLSLNNSRIGDFVHHVYPIELEMKDTTDTHRSASYLDLQLEIDDEGRLGRKHYDKRDDFNDKWNISVVICDTDIP